MFESSNHNEDELTCLFCGKPVPDGSPLPLCEKHGVKNDAAEMPEEFLERRCIVCGEGLPGKAEMPFCAAHYSQYQARQTDGVTSDQLDQLWRDRFSNWRGRSQLLESEPYASNLKFRRRWGDWLFFWMGYRSRLPDWLVVNPDTGEVRRFVEVSENDVRADIQGLPARNQEHLADRWGSPRQTTPVLTEMFAKALDAARSYKAPSLADVILEAGMPVYVPANSQEDLLLASIGSGSSGSSNVSLTLTFANQPTKDETPSRTEENLIAVRERIMRQRHEKAEGEGRTSTNSAWTPLLPASEADPGAMPVGPKFPPLPTKVLELSYSYEVMEENIDRQEERVDYRFQSGWDDFARQLYSGTSAQVKRQLSEFESKRLCLQTHSILWSVAPDMVDDIAASPTEAVKHRFVIDGKEFSGELLCWAHTYPLCAFRFAHSQSKHVHYLISGTSYGFPMSDAQALLQELVALNDNHALLASYQTQIDEQLQRLLSYYS